MRCEKPGGGGRESVWQFFTGSEAPCWVRIVLG